MTLYELFTGFVGTVTADPIVAGTCFTMAVTLIALDFFDMLRDIAFIFTKFF